MCWITADIGWAGKRCRTILATEQQLASNDKPQRSVMRIATAKASPAKQASAPRAGMDPRRTAVLEHDLRFDGKFVYAVKTTGVYCRPSCPARPRPENVVIYDTCDEAERAGFRACKRCHPKQSTFRKEAHA